MKVVDRLLDAVFGYDWFISYRRVPTAGGTYAKELDEALRAHGFRCFIDEREFPGGHLARGLRKALRKSSSVIVICSRSALESSHCREEIAHAREIGKTIAPIVFGTMPDPADSQALAAASHLRSLYHYMEASNQIESGPSPQLVTDLIARFRRRKKEKTQRYVFLSAALVLFLLLASSAVLGWLADKQRRRAEQRLADALNVASYVRFVIDDDSLFGQSVDPVRRNILERTRTMLENLRAEDSDDHMVILEAALNSFSTATVEARSGDLDLAASEYDKALKSFRSLVAEFPEDTDFAKYLGWAFFAKANAMSMRGDADESESLYLESIATLEPLGVIHQGTDANGARMGLVQLYYQQARLSEATNLAKAVLAEISQQQAQYFLDHEFRLLLSGVHLELAKLLSIQTEDANTHLEKALVVLEPFGAKAVVDEHLEQMLLDRFVALAQHAIQRGNVDLAEAALEPARGFLERLIGAGANSNALRNTQATLLSVAARVHSSRGRTQDAIPVMKESVEMYRELGRTDPNNHLVQTNVLSALVSTGQILMASGDYAGAVDRFAEASSLAERLLQAHPRDHRLVIQLCGAHCGNLAVLALSGDLDGASVTYEAINKSVLPFIHNHPDFLPMLGLYRGTTGVFAKIMAARGRAKEALGLIEQSLEQLGDRVASGMFHEEFFATYMKVTGEVVDLRLLTGDVEQARVDLDTCLQLVSSMSLTHGTSSSQFDQEAAKMYGRLGDIEFREGHADTAMEAYKKAENLLQGQVEAGAADELTYWILFVCLDKHATVVEQQSGAAAARNLLLGAIVAVEAALDIEPDSINYRRAVTSSYSRLLEASGEPPDPINETEYTKAIEHAEALTLMTGATPEDHRGLALRTEEYGLFLLALGRPDKARSILYTAREQYRELVAAHLQVDAYADDLRIVEQHIAEAGF